MSAPAAGAPRTPRPLSCPRCGREVAPDQDWCLECGAPARTRVAATPNWRLPTVAMIAAVLVAGVALAFAFASLTDEDGEVAARTAPVPAQTGEAPASTVPSTPSAP